MLNLKFYIIYTPETFTLLSAAIKSLLMHSPYRFTLVANGLNDTELKAMIAFTSKNNRMEFLDLPGSVIIPHGTALMHLLQHHDEDYFCFADSDIFATANFSKELNQLVLNNDVFSSCKPLEWTTKPSQNGYRGHNWISPSGLKLAMTYFSIYKTELLRGVLDKYKISLERYMRQEQVPSYIHPLISKIDQHNWKFNTAKLVNLLQATEGMKLYNQEFENLIHLGGISRFSVHNIEGTRKPINSQNSVAVDRLSSRNYFYQLLDRLSQNPKLKHFPELNIVDPQFKQSIVETSHRLQSFYQKLSIIRLEEL